MGAAASIPGLLAAAVFGAGFCVSGGQVGANALAAAFYPTACRTTGVSWALGVGRGGSIVGSLIGGVMLAQGFSLATVYCLVAVPAFIAAFCMEQLRESADARGVSLVNAVEPVNLTIDFSRLELVLVNLISNGIKYRDPAKANNAVVEVTRTNDAGGIQLHIRDNGLGIPASQQSRVFRRFFRAHSSRDAELGNVGIGLGLAIAAESVKALKGTLTFQSEEGRGTVFTLALPN